MTGLQPSARGADTEWVKLRTPTLDLIATEFATAVASDEFERAEGWLAVAQFAAARQAECTRQARGSRLMVVTREPSRSRAG